MDKIKNKLIFNGRLAWLYIKYQLITKGLLSLIIFPLSSKILQLLLRSTGRVNISSGDYLQFLLSFQGVGMLLLALTLLTLLIGIDVNSFIIMSALVREGRIKLTARHLLLVSIKSLRSFLKPSGILIMVYIAIVVPLVGIGISISPMKAFHIPNFITEVIFKNSLYRTVYVGILFILTFITLHYIFFLHYVLLLEYPIGDALKSASALMRKCRMAFIRDFMWWTIKWAVAATTAFSLLVLLLLAPMRLLTMSLVEQRAWSVFAMLLLAELVVFAELMLVPFFCNRLTELFYRYHERHNAPVVLKIRIDAHTSDDEGFLKLRLRTKAAFGLFLLGTVSVNLILALFFAAAFDDIFRVNRQIEIVAHRGGGNLAAENTVASLEAVIRKGVAWSEIDVQRTMDGHYVVNHDSSFLRVAGESRSSSEMTLAEIKRLRVRDLFDERRSSQEVATIEEFLDASKGRIGLFVELKGSTADPKMADDIIAMIRARKMESEVAVLSLDYSLITYIEEHYPQIQTGFLYFFSIGETAQMNGDILIMEEQLATPEKIEEIHSAGKKAIVWTVNTQESIDHFLNSDIDGIITDYVPQVQEGIDRRNLRSDLEILLGYFLD